MRTTNAGLNRSQRDAVETTQGPLLVIAGAGTGKTRVITHRIAHIVKTAVAAPERVLALTFTKKAATEMKERVTDLLGPLADKLVVSTFHSLGYRILREQMPGVSVISTKLQRSILQNLLTAHTQEHTLDTRALSNAISKAKSRCLNALDLASADPLISAMYAKYQAELTRLNFVDLDDLCSVPVRLLDADSQLRDYYRRRWSHLLVDEYQDTNHVQFRLMRLLLRPANNVCVVGDDDQSIYGFRGANVELIRRFESDFAGATVIKLVNNYRSSAEIIGLANSVISRATTRYAKQLVSHLGSVRPVTWKVTENQEDQTDFLAKRIRSLNRDGEPYHSMAVLVRSKASLARTELRHADIPCASESQNGVTVMSLHSAKGLEWDTVFLPSVDDNTLPHYFAVTSQDPEALEEERRLFYVGVTRAKQRLVITTSRKRGKYLCEPSRFLTELSGEKHFVSEN